MYTLRIICPHCARTTAITDWPRAYQDPVLFTCITKRGGCGGHALVQPPDVIHFPNLEVVIATGMPLITEQAAALEASTGH